MEGFVVSARKYRPGTFDAVIGQSHVTDTLKNAIKMDQLAHAFLFSGPRGVGKTTCARILAKAINCENPPEDGEPCNECASCMTFNEGRSMNIHELDAASNNSVEDIRKIIEQVRYVPTSGKKSVFIIDEVHMLSQAAFNAFLKTLEEPPAHAIFILATTEKHKILATILSRVQKFDFRRIKVDSIAKHLEKIAQKEEIEFEFDALQLIGLKADGALRDALSIFDQIVSFSNRHITYKIVVENLNVLDYAYYFKAVDMMMAEDHEGLLLLLNEILDLGFEAKDFMVGITEHFRNLLVARTPKTIGLLETSDNIRQKYLDQVKAVSPTLLLNAFNLASESDQKLRNAANPRLHIELTLLKLAFLNQAIDLAVTEKKKLSPETKAQDEKIGTPPSVSAEIPEEEKFDPFAKKIRKTSISKTAFMIPKSLDDVDLNSGKEGTEVEEDQEEFIRFDKDFKIDSEAFQAALEVLLQKLTDQRNFRIASLLKRDGWKVEGNRWTQTVTSEVARRQLQEERHLLEFMREELNVANLMLVIEVQEISLAGEDQKPYTNEEKLDIMLKKNPDLREFMSRFDTLMNY